MKREIRMSEEIISDFWKNFALHFSLFDTNLERKIWEILEVEIRKREGVTKKFVRDLWKIFRVRSTNITHVHVIIGNGIYRAVNAQPLREEGLNDLVASFPRGR